MDSLCRDAAPAEPARCVPEAVYDSPQALAGYLARVRQRREAARLARRRGYWQEALAQIDAELALCEPGDAELEAELRAVRARFTGLLAGAEAEPPPAGPEAPEAPFPAPPRVVAVVRTVPPVAPAMADGAPRPAPEPRRAPEAPDQPDSAKRETARRVLRERIAELEARGKAVCADRLRDPSGNLDRPRCFRVRVVACELAAAEADACQALLEVEARDACQTLRDCLEVSRAYADEMGPSLPFDARFRPGGTRVLKASDWWDLAGRYEEVAEAQEAWDAYNGTAELLEKSVRHGLVNCIAARQQLLFRHLEDFGGEDQLQAELYGRLRDAAKAVGFLPALSQSTADDELAELAGELSEWRQQVERECEAARDRRLKQMRRDTAIHAVASFLAAAPPEEDLTAVRQQLFPLLDECVAAGVPPTNPQLRNALLPRGEAYLAGHERYARILEAVVAERNRQTAGTTPAEPAQEAEDDPTEQQVAQYLETVRLFTRGMRLLILGGVPKARVREELKERLGCAEVLWLPSKKSDNATKFQCEIKKADMLLLLKNFAGHDMSEKGRDWIKSVNGHFVFIPSGYGVNQLIYQLYRYIDSADSRR